MRIVPTNNNQTNFGGYFPLSQKVIYRHFGREQGEYIYKAMNDLAPIALVDGGGLDVIVKPTVRYDLLKRGITISVADEKSDVWLDYFTQGKTKNPQHVRASVLFDHNTKLEDIPKIICDNTKGLIEAYKKCRRDPSLFEYYFKIFR